MIEVNLWAVLVCGVIAMALGSVWYGPLFGKKWAEIIKATPKDIEERKKMQASMGSLYIIQFILSLFQAYVLAYYIAGWNEVSPLENSLWIWAAFIMPVVAQGAMWNNDSKTVSWARFLIQAGYQLILFILFAIVLGSWQ